MTKMMLALSLGFGGVLLATHAAQAAPHCGPRVAVLATLAEKYAETRRGMGIAANNSVMELFASSASGTWTITVTMPDGAMCLVASGEGFDSVTEELPAKGEPA